jgi:hypothetical protein
MLPSEAMPTTTVRKITGAVIVLTSCRKASASHFASFAASGAANPNSAPAPIATTTQNHSCETARRRRRPDGTVVCMTCSSPLDEDPAALPQRDLQPTVGAGRPAVTLAVASVVSVVSVARRPPAPA